MWHFYKDQCKHIDKNGNRKQTGTPLNFYLDSRFGVAVWETGHETYNSLNLINKMRPTWSRSKVNLPSTHMYAIRVCTSYEIYSGMVEVENFDNLCSCKYLHHCFHYHPPMLWFWSTPRQDSEYTAWQKMAIFESKILYLPFIDWTKWDLRLEDSRIRE